MRHFPDGAVGVISNGGKPPLGVIDGIADGR